MRAADHHQPKPTGEDSRRASTSFVLSWLLALIVLAPLPALAVDLIQLTYTNRDENWSSWLPGGSTLYLSSGETVCDRGQWFCGPQNIWVLAFQGREMVSLQMIVEDAYHPRVAPDGSMAACMVQGASDWDIYVWPVGDWAAGHTFQGVPGANERFPNWSNDGQWLAFDSDRPSDSGTTGYQVYIARVEDALDPSAARQITLLGSNNKHPTWNVDDSEIAYVGDAEEKRAISAVRLSDGRYRKITPHFSQNRHPDWSPDGRWIAFVTDRWDGLGDIAIVRADGAGIPIRVSVGMNLHDDFPEWSHDSQSISFCGTSATPPYRPNKEIFIARDLPFTQAGLSAQEESFGAFKGSFGERP